MKLALIGPRGQVGSDVAKAAIAAGLEVVPLTHADCDVTDRVSLERAFAPLGAGDIVVNTAAFHRTDECEDRPDLAFGVNGIGAHNVAAVANERGAAVAFYSSDYVFGNVPSGRPYVESDDVAPVNVYGASKVAGETLARLANANAYILRIASVFGTAGSSGKGGNFVETMLAKARRGERIEVVDDVVMSPTYAADAADLTVALIMRRAPAGIYHLANSGECSWREFADGIFAAAGLATRALPLATVPGASRIRRPEYSALASEKLNRFGLAARPWQEALREYLVQKGHIT
jgi:dTDP-4-dehydrorhamnose reductase